MTAKAPKPIDHRIVKALGHPLRQRILHALSDSVASPNQIARRLREPLGNVSYHVKILAENDVVELVETRAVRGAVEHFYRATMRPLIDDAHWEQLPRATRRELVRQTLAQIAEHLAAAGKANGFDRLETHISWTPLQLDEQGWSEVAAALESLLDRVARIEAESLERLGESAAPIRAELAVQHFERAPRD